MTTQPLVHLVADDEVKDKAKEIYKSLVASSGKVPKWVRVMANNQDILVGFFMMFKATMDDAPLAKELKWKVAKLVSDINKCQFCIDVANMYLKQFGLSDEEISQIEEKASEEERVALDFAKVATKEAYKIPPEIIRRAKEHFDDAELVELAAVVGLFNYINRFNDSLGVLPD